MAEWQNPKLDWPTNPHPPTKDDFNRIEENIAFLKEITDKKELIVDAIQDMNQPAQSTDSYEQLAAHIQNISNDADAVVENVLEGKTFYQGGSKKTGTMPNRMGDNAALASSIAGNTLKLRPPRGFFDGTDDNVTITDNNWTESYIVAGKSIFGKNGTYNKIYGPGEWVPLIKLGVAAVIFDGDSGDGFYNHGTVSSGYCLVCVPPNDDNYFYICPNDRIQKVSMAGELQWEKIVTASGKTQAIISSSNGIIYTGGDATDKTVRKITSSGTISKTYVATGEIYGLALSPDEAYLYVSVRVVGESKLLKLETTNLTLVADITNAIFVDGLVGLVCDGNGNLYGGRISNNTTHRINPNTGAPTQCSTNFIGSNNTTIRDPNGFILSSANNRVYKVLAGATAVAWEAICNGGGGIAVSTDPMVDKIYIKYSRAGSSPYTRVFELNKDGSFSTQQGLQVDTVTAPGGLGAGDRVVIVALRSSTSRIKIKTQIVG